MSGEASREQLEARIARERVELMRSLEDLGEHVRSELDLGQRMSERPSAWLAGAFLVGIWMGSRR